MYTFFPAKQMPVSISVLLWDPVLQSSFYASLQTMVDLATYRMRIGCSGSLFERMRKRKVRQNGMVSEWEDPFWK